MEYRDYYETLGVPRAASQAEIKKAFRKLAREHHPDKKPGDKAAEKRFKDANEANAVLSDPEKRQKYDQLGANWEAFTRAGAGGAGGARGGRDPFGPGGPFSGFASAGSPGRGVRYEFRTSGDPGAFSDFFEVFFGSGGGFGTPAGSAGRTSARAQAGSIDDLLGGMGVRGAGNGARAQARLAAVEGTAELDLEEAFHGTSRIVEIEGKRLQVAIPRGVDTGSRIRLAGKGGDGRDLVVIAKVRPHLTFTRRGADLERELPIRLEEALLGGEVAVGTLKGRVLLKIPAATQTGRTFRLTGQGMPKLKGDGAGDLFVRVRVVLPSDLDEQAREAARRFLELARQPDPLPTAAPSSSTGSR